MVPPPNAELAAVWDENRGLVGSVLRDLQRELQKVFVAFVFGFVASFYGLRLYGWHALQQSTTAQLSPYVLRHVELVATTPFDVVLLQAKAGLIVGVLCAVLAALYLSREALEARGLRPRIPVAKRWFVPLGALALALFVLGVLYTYYLFFPMLFGFLARNAIATGFEPHYSIVEWTEFVALLMLTFGVAAELPLVMLALSYSELVPYETFRSKWRHAVLGMVIVGSMVNGSPDPFSMSLVAIPLIGLYTIGLAFSKVATATARRSVTADLRRTTLDLGQAARTRWQVASVAGVVVGTLTGAALWWRTDANELLHLVGFGESLPTPTSVVPLSPVTATVLIAAVVAMAFAVLCAVSLGYPALADVRRRQRHDAVVEAFEALDADGVRDASSALVGQLAETDVMKLAGAAVDAGDQEKARALLDRYDAVEAERRSQQEDTLSGELEDRTLRAGTALFEGWTDGERDEDDIGGYYGDIRFVVDSVTSHSFRIVIAFFVGMLATFSWLYAGGIGAVKRDFLHRLPDAIDPESLRIVTLHPVEALVFEMKFAALVGLFVALPVVAYYAWPALRELNLVHTHRRVIFGWTAALVGGLLGGIALGYTFVAPAVITYLVVEAVRADWVIAFRISAFFWLIVYTTAGIGVLVDIPVLMILINGAGVPYRTMHEKWREVLFAVLVFAALFTPLSTISMFLIAVPLIVAYWVGLVALFALTLAGRRDPVLARGRRPRGQKAKQAK